MPSANLEVIALREICQPQKDKRCAMLLVHSQNVPSWGLPGEGRSAPSCGGLRVLRFCFARRRGHSATWTKLNTSVLGTGKWSRWEIVYLAP